jgi:hypothetical protein
VAVTIDLADDPKTVLSSFYKHQDEIASTTDAQARHVAKAIEAASYLIRCCPEHHQAMVDAAAYVVRGVWRNRVICGLDEGDDFDQFWSLVINKWLDTRCYFVRVCRSQTRVWAFTVEFKPKNSVGVYSFNVDLP